MSELERLKNQLCNEQAQLFQKLYKLDDLLVTGISSKNILAKQEQLLWMERNAIKMYIDVLQLRINEFQERIDKEKVQKYREEDIKIIQDYIKNNDKIESEVE